MARAPVAPARQDHVDGGNLALRLDKGPSGQRQVPGHVFRDVVLRGDRIAEIKPASGGNGPHGDGFIALYQISDWVIHLNLFFISTV